MVNVCLASCLSNCVPNQLYHFAFSPAVYENFSSTSLLTLGIVTFKKFYEPRGHYAKLIKQVTERQILYDLSIRVI